MRTNIVLDDELVAEAMELSKAKTKRQLVDLALRDFVKRRKRKNLMDLYGDGGIDPEYDYKKLRIEEG